MGTVEAIKQLGISLIRTIVPVIVGQIMTWLAVIGIADATGEVSAALISAITVILTAAYYAIVRFLEVKYSDQFGWLLGYAEKPTYKMPK